MLKRNVFYKLHPPLVISESMSKKFLWDDKPAGKTLKVKQRTDYIITGIFKKIPQNSTNPKFPNGLPSFK